MKSLWRAAGDGIKRESEAATKEGPDLQTGTAVPGVGGVGGGCVDGGGCLPSVGVPGVGV